MRTWYQTTRHYTSELEQDTGLLAIESDSDIVMQSFPMRTTSCSNWFGCAYHDFCTAWPNPLQRCDEPPLGFKIEFWDPRSEEMRHQMEFKPLRMIEEMLEELEGNDV